MPKTLKAAEAFLYLGKHPRGVDESHRVLLPSEWRQSGWPKDFTVLLWPVKDPEYLLVLPPPRWQLLQKNIGNRSLMDEDGAKVERFISINSYPRSLDSYGRLPIPDEAAKDAGISDEAILVGRMDKFEIWSPDRLRANSAKAETQNAFENLKNLNL